jgi:hypothetical protein
MKLKQWLKYLFYIMIILIMVLLRVHFTKLMKEYGSLTFQINYYYIIILLLINVMIGLVLGLDHLLKEIKIGGTWKINSPKLIFLGLPSLYFTIANIFMYIPGKFSTYVFIRPLLKFMLYDDNILSLFQLIFGYTIITSFYKDIKKSRVDS